MTHLTPAARLTVWGNAVLAGTASLDHAVDSIVATDPPHRLEYIPGEQGPVALTMALGRLRVLGTTALRLVLPVPGDVSGLPGPPAFNELALQAGAAVLGIGGDPLALVPTGRAIWAMHPTSVAPVSVLSLDDAERMLRSELRDCTEDLLRLDVARWQPAVSILLGGRGAPSPIDLPPGCDARSVRLLSLCSRLATMLTLAAGDDGAAVSASEIAARARVLTRLDTAVRRATEAACNSAVVPGQSTSSR